MGWADAPEVSSKAAWMDAPEVDATPKKPTGPQPTALQTLAASPVGSFLHDVVVSPVENFMNFLHPVDFSPIEKPYQAAISSQQNLPGYTDALQREQAVQPQPSFTTKMVAPIMPAAAGLIGLASGGLPGMAAAADVQRQGQADYQQQHPYLSTTASILGSLLATPKDALANVPTYPGDNTFITRLAQGSNAPITPNPVMPTPTPQSNQALLADIQAKKTAAYKAADNAGVVIKPQSFQKFATDLGTEITKNNVVQADIHPNALSALNVIQDEAASGAPMTLSRADAVRQAVNGAIEKAAGVNGSDSDLRMAMKVKDGLDSYLDGLGASDVLSGDPTTAVPILKEARGLAQREFKAQTIQQLVDLAHNQASSNYSAAGVEQALRVQFKNLNAQFIKNPSMAAGWTQAERDAIAAVAKGSPGANALRLLGKLAPTGIISGGVGASSGAYVGGMLGGPVGAAIGATAVPGIGSIARKGATAMTEAAAQRALSTALNGAAVTAAPRALSMPAITTATRIPYPALASIVAALAPSPASANPATAQSDKQRAIAALLSQ